MNAALERPDLFDRIVADSFDGRTLNEHFADNLLKKEKEQKQIFRPDSSMNGVREKIGKK